MGIPACLLRSLRNLPGTHPSQASDSWCLGLDGRAWRCPPRPGLWSISNNKREKELKLSIFIRWEPNKCTFIQISLKGVPSAESSRSVRGLGKGVSGKPYPRLYNARRPRLEPGTFRSQAVRLYRVHQARPSIQISLKDHINFDILCYKIKLKNRPNLKYNWNFLHKIKIPSRSE